MGKREICRKCNRKKVIHAKGLCKNCYTYHGTPKLVCKSCKELKHHFALGLCRRCYRRRFIKYTRELQISKEYPLKIYKKKTKQCFICNFSAIVELHHLDGNHKNNQPNNLIGLCPNHHKMIHMIRYKGTLSHLIKKRLDKNGN